MAFATHQHESAMGVHVSPHPETPSHVAPHPIPLGCLRAPALSALLHEMITLNSLIEFSTGKPSHKNESRNGK